MALQSLLENLTTAHETEISYQPIEVKLDLSVLEEGDIPALLAFVKQPRKCLFIFQHPEDEQISANLAFTARRSFLNQNAEILLKKTSTEPKINPLKKDLNTPPLNVRAAIQIQKGFALPKPPTALKGKEKEDVQPIAAQEAVFVPLELPELPNLVNQLNVLGIETIQDTALEKIREHLHAFTDGIIPSNLPKGFYIDLESHALCYTETPHRLPSALAPVLENPLLIDLPTVEQIQALLPMLERSTIEHLHSNDKTLQKNALILALASHTREITNLFTSLKPAELEFIVPLLAKLFILGGEAHTKLFVQLLRTTITKKVSIDFLKEPEAQNAFLNPRGIKNFQKLLQLPAEQREWWDTLATAHLQNEQHHFNFNQFFEAYTQIFLPQIAEKNLTLPQPCPIQHRGHFLITLNRVAEVLSKTQNPQEQCLNLAELNWGPTGVHFAMTQAPENRVFKQVAACMKLETPDDTVVKLDEIYQQIKNEEFDLKPWLFRYMGLHWKTELRLTDIQAQFEEIEATQGWSTLNKNEFSFILACSFADKSPLNLENWKRTLKHCISLLQTLTENERNDLLQALSRCFLFKPNPSLVQIQYLIEQCLEFKSAFPEQNFKDELLLPFITCLEHEGFELINSLQERVQKTDQSEGANKILATAIISFTTMLQERRDNLDPDTIKLLAALNEPEINEPVLNGIGLAIERLKDEKDPSFSRALLSLLAKINISKSQPLPDAKQIQQLLETLAELNGSIPLEHRTLDKQEYFLKDLIIEKNLLPGCVLGNGDISKLDDLIVDALSNAIKKRAGILKIDALKAALAGVLQSNFVPKKLKEQLNLELWPLFDALKELVDDLQKPEPKFEDIIPKFKYFEERKTTLLEAKYSLTLLGESKGEYILSYLLSGKGKAADNLTSGAFAKILSIVHNTIAGKIHTFFDDEQNRDTVKDLDAATTLKWFAAFNDTLSISFLFKEELVQKKVLPALKKTLVQLNTQDPLFENSILEAASDLAENKPSHKALKQYKAKIESIVSYLNLLIDLKEHAAEQFPEIFRQLNTDSLTQLNYQQKQALISHLLKVPQLLETYLQLASSVFEENPDVSETAITRAIDGIEALFKLDDLAPETQAMFFKMSMSHNLRNPSPFPLEVLNELKQSNIDEEAKSLLIKQIIQILSHTTGEDSSELMQNLVEQTQVFLTQNPHHASLCIALLKRVSFNDFNRDVGAYSRILHELSVLPRLPEGNKEKFITILTGLANSQKDDSVNLPILLNIARNLEGLRIRSLNPEPVPVVDWVLDLFTTLPYPIAQRLNSVLIAQDANKLQIYCQNFDTNPFAKSGETRALAQQFANDRVEEALINLKDLLHEVTLPPKLQLQLAQQLNYIETLGYIDPLDPYDFKDLKKLTACSRNDLKERAQTLLNQLRTEEVEDNELELIQLELLAYLREIYFRTTGLFPNSTQMVILLLSLQKTDNNLLMSIKTGEGKSLITPIFAILQWAQGGTVDVCTANQTLLDRDYENSCEPFFHFLGVRSTLIRANSRPEDYQLNGINCSTVEDMSLFRLAAKEARKEAFIENEGPIHIIIDECDDALLDLTTLFNLVADEEKEENPAQWIYTLAYQFINLPGFRNEDPAEGPIWDEDEDVEQFRLYINKKINEEFQGDADKQTFIMTTSNTQLKQWINASCKAATLIENKHFVVRPIKEKDESDNERTKKIVCVPLVKSTPKTGCIFTDSVQQALQARLIAERKEQAHYFFIDLDPLVLASQSAQGLIRFYQETKGRIVGISGTPGDTIELKYLANLYGTQALGIDPHAGDKRENLPPVFTFSREETIYSIHKTIDSVKRKITKPIMEFDAYPSFQTLEDYEKFTLQTQKAQQEWSQTQTQPILIISEDFDEAQIIGNSLEAYKRAGFTIQIVTGKESPEELERIIRQAGRVNTITIGTAMLARGIDINPYVHPEGLFVIQPYVDSKRVTTQIAGRAARNGKPGKWLPIYQVEPPKTWFEKIMYFISPGFRQKKCLAEIENLQNEIKIQATIDRLYTQSIDEAQRALMHQVQAWESLLIDLYPADAKLQYEMYLWRASLLSQLSHAQETSLSQDTLEASISQFQNTLCKIWETAREEHWMAKAQGIKELTEEDTLRLNYLKHLDLSQELKIQRAFEKESLPLKAANDALMHQNLQGMILDKAGAVLHYTNPEDEEERKALVFAQCKQLLPSLIGELCDIYPQALKELSTDNRAQTSALLEILNALRNTITKANSSLLGIYNRKKITQSIIQYYQEKLKQASPEEIKELLENIKPLILELTDDNSPVSLVDQFKLQGLILTYTKVCEQAGLPDDQELTELNTQYNEQIMERLAKYLMKEFAWVKASPRSLHAFLERSSAIAAANALYELAEALREDPEDENKIHDLYAGLQKHQVILQDKYLFSIRHTNPREVINTALTAIEALNVAPHCEPDYRETCHDRTVSTYHLTQFENRLDKISSSHRRDPVWTHLVTILKRLCEANKDQIHVITELYETLERFSTYESYLPYKNQLRALKAQLTESITALQKPGEGLKQDNLATLLLQKKTQFAHLFNIDPTQVRLQSGCDSLRSYIEIQVQNIPMIEGFTGYQANYSTTLGLEKRRITNQKENLNQYRGGLINLTDLAAVDELPPKTKSEFEKLFRLKTLVDQNWVEGFASSELPDQTHAIYEHIQKLQQWTWPETCIEKEELREIFGDDFDSFPEETLEEYNKACLTLKDIRNRKQDYHKDSREEAISHRFRELKWKDTEKLTLGKEMLVIKGKNLLLKANLTKPANTLEAITEEESESLKNLEQLALLLDEKKQDFIAMHVEQAKLSLNAYLSKTSKELYDNLEQELNSFDARIDQLTESESKKSRYQTRRFADLGELLKYEASLREEESQIPVRIAQARNSISSFFSRVSSPSREIAEPLLVTLSQ